MAAMLALACVHDQPLSDSESASTDGTATAVFELAASFDASDLERLAHRIALETATAEPLRPPPTPAEIAELREQAKVHLRELEIKIDPRTSIRGPVPEASDLRSAYAEDRALVLEGRLEQVRQWAALAKFGSIDPGPSASPAASPSASPSAKGGPLARYNLVVTRDRKRDTTAYLHVIVPVEGLAAGDGIGIHEAWIDGERWINLADTIEPGVDYLPFKTNGNESLHRQWARADVVGTLATIAADYRSQTGAPLGVGDLSHVTGGKIEDHWTHQKGVDADVYLLDPADTDPDGRPRVWWHHFKRGASLWTSKAKGKGEREPSLPSLDAGESQTPTPTSQRLQILATIVFTIDAIAYFVHNDPIVLAPFDDTVGNRRPGRRYLHAKNRGYWPTHADHVHLRWADGKLPVDVTPRP